MKYITLLFASILCLTTAHSQVIVTVAGIGETGSSGDGGPATNARMSSPNALVFDKDGNFYFTENSNPRIRKVSPSGIISVYAGVGTSGYSGDGGPAIHAEIRGGGGLCVDKWNNIYLADGDNHRVRKITTDGIIRTIAGTGTAGFNGDGILATNAQLNYPHAVAVDDTGNVYICDKINYRIRKISASGIISTVAGTGAAGYIADGARADTSAIEESWCIIIDGSNNIIFKDKNRIRKIANGTGLITTLAGNGVDAYSGDGGTATAAAISTELFTLDSVGNLFLAEGGVCRIRKVNTEGNISTLTGNGLSAFDAEGVTLPLARVNSPSAIAFSPSGELHFAERTGAKIRKITFNWVAVRDMPGGGSNFKLFPNPGSRAVSIKVDADAKEASLTIMDMNGGAVRTKAIPCDVITPIDISDLPPGVYFVKVIAGSESATKELIIK